MTALHAFYYDVLLLTTAYSACAVRFFLGQFPNMELLLLLLSLYSLLNSLYFPGWWNVTLFLTGCLCALNYMSKPDHLIFYFIITTLDIRLIASIIHATRFLRTYLLIFHLYSDRILTMFHVLKYTYKLGNFHDTVWASRMAATSFLTFWRQLLYYNIHEIRSNLLIAHVNTQVE